MRRGVKGRIFFDIQTKLIVTKPFEKSIKLNTMQNRDTSIILHNKAAQFIRSIKAHLPWFILSSAVIKSAIKITQLIQLSL
jgi:hypothetical protein